MIPLYQKKDGALRRLDDDSPFPEIDLEYAYDPFEEISDDIVAIMEGMASIHKELFWTRTFVLALVFWEIYQFLH